MVNVLELWLPILVSAVFVFIASSIIHMLLPYHRSDVKKLPNEDELLAALRRANPPPDAYAMPYATMKEMGEPEYIQKRSAGPVAFIAVKEGGPPNMGKELTAWFVYSVVISVFAGYVAGRAVGPGTVDYLEVFRYAGTVAFAGYGLGVWQESIWWGRPVSTSIKNTIDALIYALLTAGVFGWLWPGTTV